MGADCQRLRLDELHLLNFGRDAVDTLKNSVSLGNEVIAITPGISAEPGLIIAEAIKGHHEGSALLEEIAEVVLTHYVAVEDHQGSLAVGEKVVCEIRVDSEHCAAKTVHCRLRTLGSVLDGS